MLSWRLPIRETIPKLSILLHPCQERQQKIAFFLRADCTNTRPFAKNTDLKRHLEIVQLSKGYNAVAEVCTRYVHGNDEVSNGTPGQIIRYNSALKTRDHSRDAFILL